MMQKTWKRILSAVLTAALVAGNMTLQADALTYYSSAQDYGQLIQPVVNQAQGLNGYCLIQLVPVGSTIRFNEEVSVGIYAEDEHGQYAPEMQDTCTRYTIEDAKNTYVFVAEDGSVCMFRGSKEKGNPIRMAGDHERQFSLKLSQPVVGITVEELTLRSVNRETGEAEYVTGNYLVYEVARGTTVSAGFGEVTGLMLGNVWDKKGVQLDEEAMKSLAADQFPEAQQSFLGTPLCPITLDEAGYYYQFLPMTIACSPPVFKVVRESAPGYDLRQAQFTDMNWSAGFVEKVYAYRWMEGMSEDTFSPESSLTIAQAVTLAARLHSEQYNCVIPTADGPWYQSFFEYCKKNGVLSNFDPDELYARINTYATRMDMVKILDGAARVSEVVKEGIVDGYVPDVREWADDGGDIVYRWYRAGITGGKDDNHSFCPNDQIARGEVAVILCQLLDLV